MPATARWRCCHGDCHALDGFAPCVQHCDDARWRCCHCDCPSRAPDGYLMGCKALQGDPATSAGGLWPGKQGRFCPSTPVRRRAAAATAASVHLPLAVGLPSSGRDQRAGVRRPRGALAAALRRRPALMHACVQAWACVQCIRAGGCQRERLGAAAHLHLHLQCRTEANA